MAETIVGAKSKLYIKEAIPGITESGDSLQHITAQEISGNRVGLDTVIHGVHKTHTVPKVIEAGSVKRKIIITAHGARKGDIFKISNGAAIGEEVAILKIEDANTFIIATEVSAAIGDEVFIMRHITPLYDDEGALIVNATQGPAQFVRNSVDIEVNEDTVTVANNRPMPGGMYIKKDDGSWYPVTLDTSNPYAHTPIPVVITDVTGTSNVNVDLSGSTLSVNIEHDGASPSSIRIGDGTTLASVTVNNELKVKDTDVETVIGAVNTVAPLTDIASSNINGRLQRVAQNITSLSNQLPITLGTQTTSNSLAVNIASDQVVSVSLPVAINTDIANIDDNTKNTSDRLGDLNESEPVDELTASGLNGRLKRIASRLTLLISKLPATLGQGTMAQSLTVTMASNQTAIPVAISGAVVEEVKHAILHNASTTNITTASYVEILASTSAIIKRINIQDDSGELIGVYRGPAASEVLVGYFGFGGNELPCNIPAGTRISLRSANINITSGFFNISLIG